MYGGGNYSGEPAFPQYLSWTHRVRRHLWRRWLAILRQYPNRGAHKQDLPCLREANRDKKILRDKGQREDMESQVASLQRLVQQQKDEIERHRRGHTQVLRDLNRFKASQGIHTITDDFLTQKTLELRQDIRDFAIQYFLGELDTSAVRHAASRLESLMANISPVDPYTTFLLSPTRAASAVEAFVWAFLARNVFGRWWWAGSGRRRALCDMCRWMKPQTPDRDAERRFYAWRATTAQFIADMPDMPDTVADAGEQSNMVEAICAVLQPYLRVPDRTTCDELDSSSGGESYADDLHRIIDKAIEFDRETSQQAARLEWVFCWSPGGPSKDERDSRQVPMLSTPPAFDEEVMALPMYEELSSSDDSGHAVLLVVAPGLRKHGKSNGEDYATETMLLKMEVSCEPVTDLSK